MNKAQQELHDFLEEKFAFHMEKMGMSARIDIPGIMRACPFYEETQNGQSFRTCHEQAEHVVEGFIVHALLLSLDHHLHETGQLAKGESLLDRIIPKEIREIMESDDSDEVKMKKLKILKAKQTLAELMDDGKVEDSTEEPGENLLGKMHKMEQFEPHMN